MYPVEARSHVSRSRTWSVPNGLYEFHDIGSVREIEPHDGHSQITVSAVDWRAQFNELWAALVPAFGSAETVQGEIIRLLGHVHAEQTGDAPVAGDGERDAELAWLAEQLDSGARSPFNPIRMHRLLASVLRGAASEHELDELVQYGVRWVLAHPHPQTFVRRSR